MLPIIAMRIEPKTIRTDAGVLHLTPATIEELRGIVRYWPMELIGDTTRPDYFGLVFQHGDEEVHGVKLQSPDMPESTARIVHAVSRIAIASALPAYLAKRHKGVMVPCAYRKEKPDGLFEAGFAFFVGPDSESRSRGGADENVVFDETLGAGATAMISDMKAAVVEAIKASGFPFTRFIGNDVRPRLAVGAIAMHFVIAGPQVLVVKDPLVEAEPVWKYVVEAGFSNLPYAPMRPAGFAGQPPANMRHL
jgi:hypothetical protein